MADTRKQDLEKKLAALQRRMAEAEKEADKWASEAASAGMEIEFVESELRKF